MNKLSHLLLSVCALLFLTSCARQAPMEPAPREPDPRDISDVAYIISSVGYHGLVIEDPELISELTDSVNGMREELGVYDGETRYPGPNPKGIAEGEPYEGCVTFYDGFGKVLAHVVYYDGRIYRDNYYYGGQNSILFDRERLESIGEKMPEGVSRITELWFECMWAADKVWVEDTESGMTAVITDKALIDSVYDHFTGLIFRVDEPCGEGSPCRFRVKWIYSETDELLEQADIGEDGRIKRDGNWCTPLNGPIDTKLLSKLLEAGDGRA